LNQTLFISLISHSELIKMSLLEAIVPRYRVPHQHRNRNVCIALCSSSHICRKRAEGSVSARNSAKFTCKPSWRHRFEFHDTVISFHLCFSSLPIPVNRNAHRMASAYSTGTLWKQKNLRDLETSSHCMKKEIWTVRLTINICRTQKNITKQKTVRSLVTNEVLLRTTRQKEHDN
jgi:hypothetical protein